MLHVPIGNLGEPNCIARTVFTNYYNNVACRFFSIVFYISNWLFVVFFAFSFIVACIRQPATFEREMVYTSDTEEEEDSLMAKRSTKRRVTAGRSRYKINDESAVNGDSYNAL